MLIKSDGFLSEKDRFAGGAGEEASAAGVVGVKVREKEGGSGV